MLTIKKKYLLNISIKLTIYLKKIIILSMAGIRKRNKWKLKNFSMIVQKRNSLISMKSHNKKRKAIGPVREELMKKVLETHHII
jgi:hypothetical protein